MERMVASFNALTRAFDANTTVMKQQIASNERAVAAQKEQARVLMEYSAAFQEQVGVLVRVLSAPPQPARHFPPPHPVAGPVNPLAAAAHGFLSRLASEGGRPPGY